MDSSDRLNVPSISQVNDLNVSAIVVCLFVCLSVCLFVLLLISSGPHLYHLPSFKIKISHWILTFETNTSYEYV